MERQLQQPQIVLRGCSAGQKYDANTERSLRESAWNDILNTYVWNKYYEEVGLGVSDEELEDLLYGPTHAHNIIVQNFGLQKNENGEYDTKAPKNFFDNAEEDPNYKVIADYWKKAIAEDQKLEVRQYGIQGILHSDCTRKNVLRRPDQHC